MKITRTSKKEELWLEVERLHKEAEQARTRATILESELAQLKGEHERLSERSRFVEELSGRVRSAHEKLEILTSLTKELASFDLDGVLEVCVQRIPFMVGARYASVYLRDASGRSLVLKHHTHDREIDRTVDLEASPESLMALAVRDRRILCIDDLGRFAGAGGEVPNRPHRSRYVTASCIVAPLIAAGAVEGVLNLADRFDHRPFDPEGHLSLIQQTCELLAVSVRNSRLFFEVEQAARTCSLTGLMNRQAFNRMLDVEVARAQRYGNKLAVVTCRLHGMGLVNASHGHQAGDQVLRQAAALLQGRVRNVDAVGRTGGAEFGIILPEQTMAGALVVARRLSGLLAETRFAVGEGTQALPATIGVVEHGGRGSGAELYQEALARLEQARAAGAPIGWAEDPAAPSEGSDAPRGEGAPRGESA